MAEPTTDPLASSESKITGVRPGTEGRPSRLGLLSRWGPALLGVLVVAAHLLLHASPSPPVAGPAELRGALPAAEGFRRADPPPHYLGLESDGRPVGAVFRTIELGPSVQGYNDEIDLLVGLDSHGRVTAVRLLSHHETPVYMASVLADGFLERYKERSLLDPWEVDVVSGATVTCRAIDEDMRSGARVIAEQVLGLELPPEEQASFLESFEMKETAKERFIQEAYGTLGLISFLTMGEDECRAWPIKKGYRALDAAGKIHSDIARGFIRAETVSYADFKRLGSEAECKKAGLYRLEGKEYIVEDGDIINFRFNV